MKDVIVHLSLRDVWAHAELDFQTFMSVNENKRQLVDFSGALESEPGFFQNEWSRISVEILERLPGVYEISFTTELIRIKLSLPDSAPEGIGAVIVNLVRGIAVKRLLGSWNELRLGGWPTTGTARPIPFSNVSNG